jgi:Domain of unknown function (DUF5062)
LIYMEDPAGEPPRWRSGFRVWHRPRRNSSPAKRGILKTDVHRTGRHAMKKLKHEAELFKAALLAAVKYAEGRGAVEFEATDSASQKLLYVYRLLVHDKIMQALPEDQVSESALRHKLAIWYSKQLPEGHPLLS